MSISLKNISKIYGEQSVVNDVSLEIFPGELFVLLGASGSGKTTILRMIAGLVSPDRGEILLQGKVVNDLTPQERNVGFVFQNYSLFRHMTVAENIGFGLQIRRVPREEREKKINHLLELIGLPGFGHRYPSQLSGGQQQRVAVARALAYEPSVLLLDEPFGALDLKTRMQLRQSLKQIHRQLGVTTVMVTHDQADAFELGDRIGIMDRGKLLATGAPADIYKRPKSEYVAQFLGSANFFTGVMQERHIQIGSAFLPLPEGTAAPEKGERVQVLIRPEQLEVAPSREGLCGTFVGEGEIRDCLFVGGFHRMTVQLSGIVRSLTAGFGDTDPTVLSVQMGMAQTSFPVASGQKVAVGVTSFHILPYQGLHVLVGIDGSEHGEHALHFASYLARKTQGRLTILGVAERYLEETKAREGLTQASQIAQKELQEVTTAYRRGASRRGDSHRDGAEPLRPGRPRHPRPARPGPLSRIDRRPGVGERAGADASDTDPFPGFQEDPRLCLQRAGPKVGYSLCRADRPEHRGQRHPLSREAGGGRGWRRFLPSRGPQGLAESWLAG